MGIIEIVGNTTVDIIVNFFENFETLDKTFVTYTRWIIAILVLIVIVRSIVSLLSNKSPSEVWAYLAVEGGITIPLTHWENVIGRSKSSDVVLRVPTVSSSHGLLVRKKTGKWMYTDLGSKSGTLINGYRVNRTREIKAGDVITVGGLKCQLVPASLREKISNLNERRRKETAMPPWASLLMLTAIQIIMVVQFVIANGTECSPSIPFFFILFTVLMWTYCLFLKVVNNGTFEIEIIVFFLCTLSLAIVATADPSEMGKQFFAIVVGIVLYSGMCWFLRDIERALKIRIFLVMISAILLLINVIFGTTQYGSTNWVEIGDYTIQPSELVKIAFIFIGSATLDELYQKKNTTLFVGFSMFCLVCLGIMGDFGTALIYFVTFLVISFLRSGEFSKLLLMIGAAGIGGFLILRFTPYIAERFSIWGNAWSVPDSGGYQHVRTMSATASGGMTGVGGGEGWLHYIGAADTDLVFGIISEEWGLLVAIFAILSIVTLALFAYKSIQIGRSTFYTIAACSATSLLIFQTSLNVFGSVDLLPLTGVTFPFVSNGGTSMVACWGMLAFIKAVDTRESASIAVKHVNVSKLEGGSL